MRLPGNGGQTSPTVVCTFGATQMSPGTSASLLNVNPDLIESGAEQERAAAKRRVEQRHPEGNEDALPLSLF